MVRVAVNRDAVTVEDIWFMRARVMVEFGCGAREAQDLPFDDLVDLFESALDAAQMEGVE